MCPRPRKASDEQIFAAAQRVMMNLGPAQWTLADIAREAGLTAGALVQRFGSKHTLQLALTERWASSMHEMFAELRRVHASPLDGLRGYAECIAQMGQTPGTLAHHLSYLQLDLTDPDLHRHVRAGAIATRAELRALIAEAVAAGELVPSVDTMALARAVEVALNGSLLTWAFHQDGPASDWVLADLDAVLRPYFPKAAATGRRHATKRSQGRHGSSQAALTRAKPPRKSEPS